MTEEEPGERGGCAGYLVLAVLISGAVVGLYLISRTVFILAVWGVGWGAVIHAARKPVQDAPNPSPTGDEEPLSDTEPQFSITKDPDHSSRWRVDVDQGKQGHHGLAGELPDDQVRDDGTDRGLLRRLLRRG